MRTRPPLVGHTGAGGGPAPASRWSWAPDPARGVVLLGIALGIYGTTGLVVLLLMDRRPRVLVAWATVSLVLLGVLYALFALAPDFPAAPSDYLASVVERLSVWVLVAVHRGRRVVAGRLRSSWALRGPAAQVVLLEEAYMSLTRRGRVPLRAHHHPPQPR